ncbi:MAG TPA: YggS family pyridoxal phosphate-dependent enzyme [Thermoanaerobaculia bacterium]|nr:YggS family pyridoxal phosphate-dependent enzyme [Thermoanaerobaculia bacterium]
MAARREEALAAIARAADRAGRDPRGIALLAVTKGHGPDAVRAAARAGQLLFGENRVAEGAAKIEAVRKELPQLSWRLIGSLQTNKAAMALQYFSALESLDRQRLVERLERLLGETGRQWPVLIEVNLGQEPTKSGVLPAGLEELAALALDARHLDVRGLMAVPPFDPEAERTRPFFRKLRELRDSLANRFGRPFPELSMGMSHDYPIAVEEGSTEVRLGTALFGPREIT